MNAEIMAGLTRGTMREATEHEAAVSILQAHAFAMEGNFNTAAEFADIAVAQLRFLAAMQAEALKPPTLCFD